MGEQHHRAYRVLAVDDDELSGWFVKAHLWGAGYEVVSVASGAEGFLALQQGQFDLILLDMHMPGLGGLPTLEIINRDQLAPGVPVLFLSASDNVDDIRRARDLGALGYVTKDALVELICTVVSDVFAKPDTLWIDNFHRLTRAGQGRDSRPLAQERQCH